MVNETQKSFQPRNGPVRIVRILKLYIVSNFYKFSVTLIYSSKAHSACIASFLKTAKQGDRFRISLGASEIFVLQNCKLPFEHKIYSF